MGLIPFFHSEEEALAKIKRERKDSPEGLFIAPDERIEMSTGAARTSLSSGPYTGLQSAKKSKHHSSPCSSL